jgi:hypothetical protein
MDQESFLQKRTTVRNAWSAVDGSQAKAQNGIAWVAQIKADRRPRCRPCCAERRLRLRCSSRR